MRGILLSSNDWLIDWLNWYNLRKTRSRFLPGLGTAWYFPSKYPSQFPSDAVVQHKWPGEKEKNESLMEKKFTEKTKTWRNFFFFFFSLQQFPCKPPRNVACFRGPDWTPPNGVPILATWRDICPDDETADSVPPSGGWCCSCDTGCRLPVFRKTPRALPCEFARKKQC